jgi:hypothetical protein
MKQLWKLRVAGNVGLYLSFYMQVTQSMNNQDDNGTDGVCTQPRTYSREDPLPQ